MRSSDCDLIFVPGQGGSEQEHWQTRWEQKLTTARRVHQLDWERPNKALWVDSIVAALDKATKPTIIIAHSVGVLASVAAMQKLGLQEIKNTTLAGAFLVAPAGKAYVISTDTVDHTFADISHAPLPVPSTLIASHNDPFCPFLDVEEMAFAWGSAFVDAGESGHLNVASGHGPWPEGLMRFAGFLSKLDK